MKGKCVVMEKEVVDTIYKTKELLEELLETLDIMADEEAMRAIESSEKDIKERKVRRFAF